jgi:MFS family permease/quinol monooxygenase YgiN
VADTTASAAPPSHTSGWEPLKYPDYRRLWLAQFTSNIGSWMQTVAAQWLITSLSGSALLLTATSAAGSLPVLLLAIPAGVLGDLLDRRRVIFVAQVTMLLGAAGLALLAAFGALQSWSLLALLFVIGVGGAAGAPTWQTLQPELVPEDDRPQAIALGSVNQNLARAIGPAIGGILLAATSAALVFGVNAVSFVAVLAAVVVTRIPLRTRTLPREHAFAAVAAGGRFVRSSPVLLALLVRSVAFVFFAGAIWALLPLVARHRLGLGSGGYGLLLGCVGLGALGAATLGPATKRLLAPKLIYTLACFIVAAASVLLAVTHSVALVAVALVAAGACWITGLGLMSTAYQGQLPAWVKARSFSYYLVAFQGASAIGALGLGGVAQAGTVVAALFVIAGGLVASGVLTLALPLPISDRDSVLPADPLPLPEVEVDVTHGPVVVTVEYNLADGSTDAFLQLTRELRQTRRRTGAVHWHLHQDLEAPARFTEMFVVGSWEEHERQHARLQRSDQAVFDRIDRLLQADRPRTPRHALGVAVPRRSRSSASSF